MKQLLRQIPVLWIWDNVEPVAGFPEGTESSWTSAEQAELRDFLHQLKLDSASRVKVLLTSRRAEQGWLGGVPYRIAMPRMRPSDAAKLALSLSESLNSAPPIRRQDVGDWQPLLDYCQGNPLTLRVLISQALQAGLRGESRLREFVEAIRSGEQAIVDTAGITGGVRSLPPCRACGCFMNTKAAGRNCPGWSRRSCPTTAPPTTRRSPDGRSNTAW